MAVNGYDEGLTPESQAILDEVLRRRGISSKTDEGSLDAFNQQLRASAPYQAFLRSIGVRTDVAPGQPWRLTDKQRTTAANWLRANGVDIGKGMEVDPSGNLNDDQGWSKHRKWAIPAAIAAGTLGLGAAGIGPLAGVMGAGGGGSAAGAASGGAGLGGLYTATPAAIASQGVSAAGAAGGAGAAGAWGGVTAAVKGASKVRDLIEAGAGAMAAGPDTMAGNRAAKLTAEIAREELDRVRQADYRDYSIAREQDRRASGTDAWRKLQQAEYAANAEGYKPKGDLPSYGFGPKGATATEKIAAQVIREEAMRRLQAGDSLLPAVEDPGRYEFDEDLINPSTAENVLGYGATAAGIASMLPSSVGKSVAKAGKRLWKFIR